MPFRISNNAFGVTVFIPFTTLTPPIILTFHRKHVPRQAHPLPWRGLGRLLID